MPSAYEAENPNFVSVLVGDIQTPEDGYRALAVACVERAFKDYVDCLVRPNFDPEVREAHRLSEVLRGKYKSIRQMALWVEQQGIYDDEEESLLSEYKDSVLKTVSELSGIQISIGNNHTSKWVANAIEGIVMAKDMESLREAVLRTIQGSNGFVARVAVSNYSRIKQRKEIEEFVNSDLFTLYTKGTIDPSAFFQRAQERAREEKEKENDRKRCKGDV